MEWKKTVLQFLFLKKQISLYIILALTLTSSFRAVCGTSSIQRKDWEVEKGMLASTFGVLQHITVYIY